MLKSAQIDLSNLWKQPTADLRSFVCGEEATAVFIPKRGGGGIWIDYDQIICVFTKQPLDSFFLRLRVIERNIYHLTVAVF